MEGVMPSNEEMLKEKIEELGKTVSDFKQANDERLKLVEAKGEKNAKADPLLEEKVDKANEQITSLETQMKSLETAINRKATPSIDNSKLEEKFAPYIVRNGFVFKDDKFNPEADAEYKKGMQGYLARGTESKALSVGSDPDGGYTVRPEIGEMIKTVIFETSPFRQWFGQQSISSDAFEFNTDGDEIDATWVGETQARNETASNVLGNRRIEVFELTASPRATQKLLDDSSINQEQFLAQKASEKFAREEADQFANGDGVIQPRGFLTYPAGTGAAQIEQIDSGTSAQVEEDGLVDMEAALKDTYRQNANWFMARATISAVRKLKDGQGRYIWEAGLQKGIPSTILTYPVIEATDMPAIAADSLSIALGDFRRGYKIVDRIGIRVLRDPFTAKPFVVFDFTKRVGGDVVVFEAIKLQKLA